MNINSESESNKNNPQIVSGSLLPLDVHKKARELSAGEFIDLRFAKNQ